MAEEPRPSDAEFVNRLHKRRIKRTLVHLSFVFLCIFTSYRSIEVTQSSLNFEDGLGTVSLSVLYSAFGLACLSIGPVVVSIIKPKWALMIGCVVHTLYIVTNMWPLWGTLVPASVALGIVSAFIWITQGIYITNLALEYSRHSQYTFDVLLSKFLGIFFIIFGSSGPLGSLICSVVLGQAPSSKVDDPVTVTSDYSLYSGTTNSVNHTHGFQQDICGPNHCPYMDAHTKVLQRPNQTFVYILIGIFLGFDVMGIILCFLLPDVPYPQQVPVKTKLVNIVSIFKSVDLMLMIPIYYFLGLFGAVFFGSFAMSFVSCPYGIDYVGYTMMAEGIAFVLISLIINRLAKVLSRPVQMATMSLLTVGEVVVWILWTPREGQFWILIVLAGFFGMSRALVTIQCHALTSLLFPHCPESAYGHNNIWQSAGYITGFGISFYLCFAAKAWFVLGCTGLMIITYIVTEVRLKRRQIEKVNFVGHNVETGISHLDRTYQNSKTSKERKSNTEILKVANGNMEYKKV